MGEEIVSSGGIRNVADVRGQPPPPPWSRPVARTRGLPGAEARPDPRGSRQPLPSRCSSPADEAATARRPPPPRHQPGGSSLRTESPARPSPDGARKGPYLGCAGAAAHQHRHAANGRATAPRTPKPTGIPPPSHTAADRAAPPPLGGPRAPHERAGKERPAAASAARAGPGGPCRQWRGGKGTGRGAG
nr:translation initiation factor IF-2-like [Aegilops tauschii subsp. strangulata]